MRNKTLILIALAIITPCVAGVGYIYATDTCITSTCKERKHVEFVAISESKWEETKSDFQKKLDFEKNLLDETFKTALASHQIKNDKYSAIWDQYYYEYNCGASAWECDPPPEMDNAEKMRQQNNKYLEKIKKHHAELYAILTTFKGDIDSYDVIEKPNSAKEVKDRSEYIDKKQIALMEIYKKSGYFSDQYIKERLDILRNYIKKSEKSYNVYASHIKSGREIRSR